MFIEHQEARRKRTSTYNYSSDDSKHVNPFDIRQTRNFLEWLMRSLETIKIDLPKYHGRLQPEEFLDWLSVVEKFFEYRNILKNQKVKLVATRLYGYVSAWRKTQY